MRNINSMMNRFSIARAVLAMVALAALMSGANAVAQQERVLYNFSINSGGDVTAPYAGVVFDGSGNMYEETGGGDGAIFELSPKGNGWTWAESVLAYGTGGYYPF